MKQPSSLPAVETAYRRKKQRTCALKDVASSTRPSTSTSTSTSCSSSISVEAVPRGGCFRFLDNASNYCPRSLVHGSKNPIKTPKSAPNPNPSKFSRSKPSKQGLGDPKISGRRPKPSPARTPTSTAVRSDRIQRQRRNRYAKDSVDNVVTDTPELRSSLFGGSANRTPAMDEDRSATKTVKTPPIEASISPEIQCRSSSFALSAAARTPAPPCYGAGHIVSGVTDRRKCRPRGFLSGKTKLFGSCGDDGCVPGFPRDSSVSPVPSPVNASLTWLSPCREGEEDPHKDNFETKSHETQRLVTFQSPWPFNGGDKVYANVCTATSTTSPRTKGTACISGTPRSSSLLSPHCRPSCKAIVSKGMREHYCSVSIDNSPFSMDSLGSDNVIQTPQSDYSADRGVGPTRIELDGHVRSQLNAELDSVAEALQRTDLSTWDPMDLSFQFPHMTATTASVSADLTHFNKAGDVQTSCINTCMSQSQSRISRREGLVSRVFQMDETAICRCLSDDEEGIAGCSISQWIPQPSSEVEVDGGNGKATACGVGSPEFMENVQGLDGKSKERVPSQRHNAFAESICTDGSSPVASGDSDWSQRYRNSCFKYNH